MKKIFLALAAGFIPAVAIINNAYAQSAADTLQNARDTAFFAQNEKDISKTKAPFNAGIAAVNNTGAANAADVKSINRRAIKNFNTEYNKADAVQWFTLKDGLVAYCRVDGVRNRIFYNKNGSWSHSILDYGEKNLPRDVRAIVKSTYYDFFISGANEIHIEDKIVYLVYIRDEKSCKTLRICDGEMEVINSFTN